MCVCLHAKYKLFLSDFNENWIFLADFIKMLKSNFIKIRQVSAVIARGRTDRRTDGRDEAISGFSQIFRTRLKMTQTCKCRDSPCGLLKNSCVLGCGCASQRWLTNDISKELRVRNSKITEVRDTASNLRKQKVSKALYSWDIHPFCLWQILDNRIFKKFYKTVVSSEYHHSVTFWNCLRHDYQRQKCRKT